MALSLSLNPGQVLDGRQLDWVSILYLASLQPFPSQISTGPLKHPLKSGQYRGLLYFLFFWTSTSPNPAQDNHALYNTQDSQH